MNQNCLEGMLCPACGSYEPFEVAVRTQAIVFDDGTDHTDQFGLMRGGDTEWDDDSSCRCCECNHEGTVGTFTCAHQATEITPVHHADETAYEVRCQACGARDPGLFASEQEALDAILDGSIQYTFH
jgi:hypothetical protein